MKTPLVAAALVALIACKQGEGDDYMVVDPGSDITHPGGPGSTHDAAIGDSSDGGSNGIAGRVCLAADSRQLDVCAGSGAGGFVVTVGSASTITADDGAFVLVPTGPGILWQVTGSTIVTSAVTATSPGEIPALTTELYGNMSSDTGGTLIIAGQGAIMARVLESGAPAVGAVATSADAVSDIFYDGAGSDTVWLDNQVAGTGAFGDVWIPVLPVGAVSMSVVAKGSSLPVTVSNIEVIDGGITFVDVTLP